MIQLDLIGLLVKLKREGCVLFIGYHLGVLLVQGMEFGQEVL
jgi:hypothetical protein